MMLLQVVIIIATARTLATYSDSSGNRRSSAR